MTTSSLRRLLGTLTLALAVAVVVSVWSSSAQAQIDCDRVEYNGRIVVQCEADGSATSGGSTTGDSADGDGDDGGGDSDANNAESSGADDGESEPQSGDEDEADGATATEDADAGLVEGQGKLLLLQAFEEDEDAVAVNGVFEFDRDDRGGRRGIDDRLERVAAAEQALADAEAAAAAEEAARAAEAAQEEAERAQAELDAAAEAAAEEDEDDVATDTGDEQPEVASGASDLDSDGSGRALGWLALALGLIALVLFGFVVSRRRREAADEEYVTPGETAATTSAAAAPVADAVTTSAATATTDRQLVAEARPNAAAPVGAMMPSEAEVVQIEVPIEDIAVEGLPAEDIALNDLPPPSGPAAGQPDLPIRNPGSELSEGADFHKLPSSLSSNPAQAPRPMPVLPPFEVDEIITDPPTE